MSGDQLTSKKLFVGGLSNDVTQEMLMKKFKTFGKVASVDIHKKKSLTDDTTNVFAFVNLSATLQNINKCIRTYNDSVWNGKTLRLQIARENFLDRLAAERKDNSIVKEWSLNNNNNNSNNKKTSVTINDKTSNQVFKYVSSDDQASDSDDESEVGKNNSSSSDDDDSNDEEKGGTRMKETNHGLGTSRVESKADKSSKKRKADDDNSDDVDDDSDEEMNNKKIKLESQEDMLAEKKKNLEILTSVVGKKLEKRKLPSSFSSRNSAMQRYDPSKPGHEEFEVQEDDDDDMQSQPIAKKAKMEADDDDSSSDEEEEEDDDKTKTSGNKQSSATSKTSDLKQFAEVSSTVVDAFKKSEGFKLSSLFGNDEEDEEDEEDDYTVTQPPAKRPKLMTDLFGWDKEDVEEEESDDNDRSDDEGRMVQKKKLKVEDAAKKAGGKNKKTVAGKSSKFFFEADDPRLSEGNTFYRTDDIGELRKKWEELRPQQVDSYRLRKRRYRMGKSRM